MPAVPFPRAAYYERIGAAQSLLPLLAPPGSPAAPHRTANMPFLKQLILSHTGSIPFETLDVLLGRTVSIAPSDIYDKLVHARRGGYCFEHNILFGEALRDAGFTDIRPIAAHLLLAGEDSPLGRTHMLHIVTLPVEEGGAPQQWIVDVGFGMCVTLAPLLLTTTEPQETVAGVLRVRTRNACPELRTEWTEYVVELQVGDTWRPLYNFDLQPQKMRDFFMMNYVVSREGVFRGSFHAARACGTWVKSGANVSGDPKHAVVAETGYTYVPRGMHAAVVGDVCKINARSAFRVPEVCRASLAELGGVVPAAQSHFSTPASFTTGWCTRWAPTWRRPACRSTTSRVRSSGVLCGSAWQCSAASACSDPTVCRLCD